MPWSGPGEAFGEFFALLGRAPRRFLLLDYDGTLAPFKAERDQAFPYPGVRRLLEIIQRGGETRLVIISGRPVKELPGLLGARRTPEIWGAHGAQRLLPDGTYWPPLVDETAAAGLKSLAAAIARDGLERLAEIKPASLALHWRGQDGHTRRLVEDLARGEWLSLARRAGLTLREFDGGLEFRAPGRNKADAVGTIIAESGTEAIGAYLGDDETDEDAFLAIKGRGLSVLVRPEFRHTSAEAWLRPPEELIEFLKAWIRTTDGA